MKTFEQIRAITESIKSGDRVVATHHHFGKDQPRIEKGTKGTYHGMEQGMDRGYHAIEWDSHKGEEFPHAHTTLHGVKKINEELSEGWQAGHPAEAAWKDKYIKFPGGHGKVEAEYGKHVDVHNGTSRFPVMKHTVHAYHLPDGDSAGRETSVGAESVEEVGEVLGEAYGPGHPAAIRQFKDKADFVKQAKAHGYHTKSTGTHLSVNSKVHAFADAGPLSSHYVGTYHYGMAYSPTLKRINPPTNWLIPKHALTEEMLDESWGHKTHSFADFKKHAERYASHVTTNGHVDYHTTLVRPSAYHTGWHQTSAIVNHPKQGRVSVGVFNHTHDEASEEGHGQVMEPPMHEAITGPSRMQLQNTYDETFKHSPGWTQAQRIAHVEKSHGVHDVRTSTQSTPRARQIVQFKTLPMLMRHQAESVINFPKYKKGEKVQFKASNGQMRNGHVVVSTGEQNNVARVHDELGSKHWVHASNIIKRIHEDVVIEAKTKRKKFLGKFRGTTATGEKANAIDTEPKLKLNKGKALKSIRSKGF